MAATEAGTRAARRLDDLYRDHAAGVYRYAYAVLGNAADAEDVTQTTFMNALRALERGEQPRKPSHWLITIAHNLVRQRFRQQARAPSQVELVEEQAAAVEPSASDPSLDDLVRALQQIPPAQREALVMRELEGRPYAEIADILGISSSALETLLFRARRSLGDELENLVTCSGAERALSQQQDSRLSRKERRRLESHVRDCPRCARLATTRSAQGRAWKGLAVLPLPLSLTLLKSAPTASAAASASAVSLPTIGSASAVGAVATGSGVAASAVAAGAAATGGGFAASAVAAKVAAVVVAATVVGGAGYEGARVVRDSGPRVPPARSAPHPGNAPSSRAIGTSSPAAAAVGTAKTRPAKPAGSAARGHRAVGGQARNQGATRNDADRPETSVSTPQAASAAKPQSSAVKRGEKPTGTANNASSPAPGHSKKAKPPAANPEKPNAATGKGQAQTDPPAGKPSAPVVEKRQDARIEKAPSTTPEPRAPAAEPSATTPGKPDAPGKSGAAKK